MILWLPLRITAMTPEFIQYRKIPRWNRDIEITEKIDGTNACVYISDDLEIKAARRTGWLEPGQPDNYGFRAWVNEHKGELLKLGPGWYFGEWFGAKINRGYGLNERHFALFTRPKTELPDCVGVVPVLYSGTMDALAIRASLESLRTNGSVAVPGYLAAEGIVIFHKASGQRFKITLENDERPKGLTNA